jgi:hypothetical protein
MTKRTKLLLASLAFSVFNLTAASAQSNNILPSMTLELASNALASAGVDLSPSAGHAVNIAFSALEDAAPYLSNGVAFEAGVLYNPSLKTGKFGAFADLQVPVAGQTSIGLGGAYQNNRFLEGSVSARVGTTVNWATNIPVVGGWIGPFYTYLEPGSAWDFKSQSIAAYDFTGFIKQYDWGNPSKTPGKASWQFSWGAAVGDISTISGIDFATGMKLTWAK